jgi:HlyD family secretion protein
LLIVFVAFAAGGLVACQRPARVDVLETRAQPVQTYLAVTGEFEAGTISEIGSAVGSARIDAVLVDEGSRVSAGDILIRLDDADVRASVARREAAVIVARANLIKAMSLAAGAVDTAALASAAVASVTDLKAQRDAAATNLATARERVARAQESLSRTLNGARPELVRAAEASVTSADASVRLRQLEADRARKLVEAGAVAAAVLDSAQATLTSAQAAADVARSELEVARRPRDEDVAVARTELAEAKAAERGARTALTTAEKALRERFTARTAQVSARTTRSTSAAEIELARATLAQAQAELQEARASLAKTVLRAPFRGYISRRSAQPGEIASAGRVLLTLTSNEDFDLIADIEEKNLGALRVGQRAVVRTEAARDRTYMATLQEINRQADRSNGTIRVRFRPTVPIPELRDGLTADVNIETATSVAAIVIPASALLTGVSGRSVLTVSADGEVQERLVTLGGTAARGVVVTQGLEVGDRIIASPNVALIGQRVEPRTVNPS